ncbi:MAG: hypothetical protein AAF499_04135, partial [Pseudomonadota bacterium]
AEDAILFDCGGGVVDRLLQSGRKPSDITHLVFTLLEGFDDGLNQLHRVFLCEQCQNSAQRLCQPIFYSYFNYLEILPTQLKHLIALLWCNNFGAMHHNRADWNLRPDTPATGPRAGLFRSLSCHNPSTQMP